LLARIIVLGFIFFRYSRMRLGPKGYLLPSVIELLEDLKTIRIAQNLGLGVRISLNSNLRILLNSLPVLILSSVGTDAEVGYLKAAMATAYAPQVLMVAIGRNLTTYLPERAALSSISGLRKSFVKVTILTGLLWSWAAVAWALVSPIFLALMYGPKFLPAIPLIYPFCLALLFDGFMVGQGAVFRIMNRMDVPLRISALILGILAPIGYLMTIKWRASAAAGFFLTVVAATTLLTLGAAFRLLGNYKEHSTATDRYSTPPIA